VISGLISVVLFAFAPLIIWLAGGRAFQDAAQVLSIIAFLPMVAALSNTLGRQTMLPLHMDGEYTNVVSLAALFGVASVFFLTHKLGLRGAALGMLGVEMYVAASFAVILHRRKSILSLFFKYP
jgi:O-antigen/teichoic acid export membrane protein